MLKKPIIYLLAVLLTSCATNSGRTGSVSLLDAIEESAQRIAAELPAGSRVAIMAFESENDNLSDFIIKELTSALAGNGLEVADRQNLDFVKRELDLNMSGGIHYENIASTGRFLGAQVVITGQLKRLEKAAPTGMFHNALSFITRSSRNPSAEYLYQTNAIHVKQTGQADVIQLTVNNDQQLTRPPTPQAIRTGPRSAGNYLDRGILFLSRGDLYLATMEFNEAILHNPNFTAAFQWRGTIHLDKGNLDHAIADFNQVIRLDPNFTAAYNNRGIAHRMAGNLDHAIADFNQAIRLDPNLVPALLGRGNAYFDRGNYERAITDYNVAIRLDPNFALAFNNRGVAHRRLGNLDSAIADFNQAIRLEPDFAQAYRNRSDVHRIKGNITSAIADLNEAIRLEPNLAWAFSSRGIMHLETGNYDHAIADFETTLHLEPDNDIIRQWLEETKRRRDLYEMAN